MQDGRARFGYGNDDFVRRLNGSRKWVELVAEGLRSGGIAVDIPPCRLRNKVCEVDAFTKEEQDLVLPESGLVIEVKSRNLSWVATKDFPLCPPLVDTVSSYEGKVRTPLAYVEVSSKTESMFVVPTFTRPAWSTETRSDAQRRQRDFYYAVDLSHTKEFSWLQALCLRIQGSETDALAGELGLAGYSDDMIRAMMPKSSPA